MDRIAVSGTVDAGSIPAWSANVHTPTLLASNRSSAQCACGTSRGWGCSRVSSDMSPTEIYAPAELVGKRFLRGGNERCACAEIVRQGGVLVSVKKADPIGPAFTFRVINRSICL